MTPGIDIDIISQVTAHNESAVDHSSVRNQTVVRAYEDDNGWRLLIKLFSSLLTHTNDANTCYCVNMKIQ